MMTKILALSAALVLVLASEAEAFRRPSPDDTVRDVETVYRLLSDTRVLRELNKNVARHDKKLGRITVEPAAGPERIVYRVHLAAKTPPPNGLHGGASFTILVVSGVTGRQEILEVGTTAYEKSLPAPGRQPAARR